MSTIGWLFILAAIFVLRAAAKGRVTNLPDDISDAFLAIVRGDTDALGEVVARTGDNLTAEQADLSAYRDAGTAVAGALGNVASSVSLAAEAVRLGKAAKGYRWTATGPDYYDCSGLVWRACKNTGIYTGPRFTTATIGMLSAFKRVDVPAVNDIVVWPMHHMGIVTGNDQYYSARSVRSGIGYSKISTFGRGTPQYLRFAKDTAPR